MIHRLGIWFAFATITLQLAVFLQPLLPEKFQISPACETVVHLSSQSRHHHGTQNSSIVSRSHSEHHHASTVDHVTSDAIDHTHQHDINHQCPFCFFYGQLVVPPTLGIQEVFVRIQVRYVHLQQLFLSFFFDLQRLFLLPQGRAPPLSLSIN
ncbi:DUF2946 domain-containing protein [Acinetobacter haemolyticus]|uniref:DUF2946 domain-containing protein n=1 Tax=Acinetobacter haemolyticus TaxID=29430 RepID=UPI00148EC368|nr:DUF2946 domain-containing protein [Acinetobacter haemolyticus]